MTTIDFVNIALGAYLLIVGLASIFTGKIYGMGRSFVSKYTDESLIKYARPLGIGNLVTGVAFIVGAFFERQTIAYIIMGVGIVINLIIAYAGMKVLVKK